ncbi:MAG: flagella protein [Thermoplasmata archaeon]|nr:flagella protein [Thermoplasmata archaeon]
MAALFKKKKKGKRTEKKPEAAELPELAEITENVGESDIQSIIGDVLKGSGIEDIAVKIDDLARKVDEFQTKLERHDSMIGSLQNEINEIRKINEELQDNIKRLLDIYEVVSQRINPFIDMGERKEVPPIPEISEETVIPSEVPSIPEKRTSERETFFQEQPTEKFTLEEKREEEEEGRREKFGRPILTHIKKDYYTIVLLMRWIEFLFERVKRDRITLLLDYYVDIGWISKEVKSEIMAYARGEIQDVTKYFPEEEIEAEIEMPEGTIKTPRPKIYKKVEDWRLSAEDHLKSLLFIMKIAGIEVNKDKLNSLEQEIEKFKKSLWEYHGV